MTTGRGTDGGFVVVPCGRLHKVAIATGCRGWRGAAKMSPKEGHAAGRARKRMTTGCGADVVTRLKWTPVVASWPWGSCSRRRAARVLRLESNTDSSRACSSASFLCARADLVVSLENPRCVLQNPRCVLHSSTFVRL